MKTDRVLWSREIVSASSLSEVLGAAPEATTHPDAPLAVPLPLAEGGVTVEFEPQERDWGTADQLVVLLYVPPGCEPFARLRIDSASSTPGLQGNDYVTCYYRYLHEGWGRLEFPYENMLIFGIPDRWRAVTRVQLSLSGKGEGAFCLGGMAIEERERVRGPRMTDEELFAELNLDAPGLEGVRRAAAAGEWERAREELAGYYARRERPRTPYPTHPAPQAPFDRGPADRIVRHFILNQQLGREIDWRANPVGYLEWMHAFNRHFFLQTLTDAYLGTGDERYARELDALLTAWLEVSPPPVANNGGGDPAWETLSAACRINNAWPALWAALQGSPFFQPSTRVDMCKSFYEHAEHLIRYPTGHNWLVAESAALARVGLLFPEFRQSARWREVGLQRLEREMMFQVYRDGAQFELSPGYHRMCMDLFAGVWELATLNGHPISRAFTGRLESMYGYSMHVTRPDGTRPSLNDAGSCDATTAPELRRGHALFGRADLLYVASGGREGRVPEETSHAFPYAGHYVMRTGWDPDALWSIVDAGPFGAAHQHEDKLSLELYAYGTSFVLDPGIASYLDDPWTHHSRHTAAHNTALVDGRGQARRTNVPRQRYRVDEPEPALWASGRRLDAVWATYADGYEGLDPALGLAHSRLVLLIKPRFWLIWDLLTGEGEHEMQVLYHLGPMLAQVEAGSGVVRSNRLGLPNIEFLPLGTPDRVEIVCGEQDPVQGWLAMGGKIIPAPTAVYTLRGALPLSMGVVAAPFGSGTTSGLAVERAEVQRGEDGGTVLDAAVAAPSGERWELLFAPQAGRLARGEVEAAAQGLLVSRAGGRIASIAALNGSRLAIGGAVLCETEAPCPLIEVEID